MEVLTSWAYQRLVIWGLDAIDGMVGLAPGLTGAMKVMSESVAYRTGETVRCSSPSMTHLKVDWTGAAFGFSFK